MIYKLFNEPFYKARTIGDNIDATFGFIRENIKTVMKTVMIFSIPICAVMLGMFVFDLFNPEEEEYFFNYQEPWSRKDIIYFITFTVDFLLIMPLAPSIININYERKNGTQGIRMKEIWKYIKPNMAKTLKMPLPQIALVLFVACLITATNGSTKHIFYAILCFILFCIVINCQPAYCIGKHSYSTSISKGTNYGFNKLLVILAFSFMIILLSSLIYLWEIAAMGVLNEVGVQFLGTDIIGNIGAYILFWIIMAVLWTLATISINIAILATSIGIAFQFGAFEENNCHIELKKKIDNFDKLKES